MQKNTCGRWWTKVDYYDGQNLNGDWLVTYKIDGVRLLRGRDGKVYTVMVRECLMLISFQYLTVSTLLVIGMSL